MVVADEDVAKLWPAAPAFAWIYDITNERCPTPIATFQVDGLDPDGAPQPPMMGCHQPSERLRGTVLHHEGPFRCEDKTLPAIDFFWQTRDLVFFSSEGEMIEVQARLASALRSQMIGEPSFEGEARPID